MRFHVLDADSLVTALTGERAPYVLDTRSRAEYEAGHLPGSHNVPVHEMARRQDELPRSKVARIVLIGEPGRRGEAAGDWLALMGYADVSLVEGGVAAYRGALEKGPAPPRPPRWQPELRVIPD